MLRNCFISLCMLTVFSTLPAFAQVPEMQPTEETVETARLAIENYRGMTPPPQMDRPQRRPWDRPSREVAVPRSQSRVQDSRWRSVPERSNRWGWSRRIPRRPRYDRYGYYPYICSGPYLVWVGRVQVLVPGNCY